MRSNPAIGRPLTEKIMRAISQAYGTYVPTVTQRVYAWRWPRESVTQSQEQVSPAENEAVALAFARHYAETRGNPSSAQVEKLTATYGVRNARDLVTFIRLVTIGVLVGNTVDAVVSRFLGRPSPQTSFADEVGVLAFFFLGMVPLVPVMCLRTLINPAG